MNTYSVFCANTSEFLGCVGLEPELVATLDRREDEGRVHDIMFQLLTGPEEELVWEEEIIPAIRSTEQFDRWMGGSIV